MVDYRRMGNVVHHLGNATSTISMHNLRDMWKSPRGTVLRIQAIAVVAIMISFLLAAFGSSCRRWSNRWIVQKGFFAAHALSLSLGTYSIGLMQSSSVKSEIYPLWTVSLFTLFVCIDPVTSYNGLDYKGPLSKMVYGICLNFGYVLVMTISTISSGIASTAINMLCAITFIKGFHRSFALVQQSRIRNMVQGLTDIHGETSVLGFNYSTDNASIRAIRSKVIVDFPTEIDGSSDRVTLNDVDELSRVKKDEVGSCHDVCVAFCLSHKLQRHILGLGHLMRYPAGLNLRLVDYNWALKVIEIELGFLYEVFFTGNPFLHYYQAKTASFWALVSFIGICFFCVAVAISETISSSHGGSINIVDTTTADRVLTFVIMVSMALLQLLHLIRCWTSNWARLAVACSYARNQKKQTPYWRAWWIRLKAYVATCTNWSDKHLWQDKIGQYSVLPEGMKNGKGRHRRGNAISMVDRLYRGCVRLVKMVGLDYLWEVLWDLLGSDTNKRAAIPLDVGLKASIVEFLGQIENDRLDGNWLSFSHHPGISVERFVPYVHAPILESHSHGYRYTGCFMMWYFATWYCELVEQELEKKDAMSKAEEGTGCRETDIGYLKKAAAAVIGCFRKAGGRGEREENRNRRVANALSKYCAYLVVSAPELLPGQPSETKRAYDRFAMTAQRDEDMDVEDESNFKERLLGAMSDPAIWTRLNTRFTWERGANFWNGIGLALVLLGDHPPLREDTHRSDPWETLALVWVRMLVYAAPYGNAEAHIRHLAQGGEFITHLWALLYHLDIREWKLPEKNLHTITTVEDAEKIFSKDDHAVVAFIFGSSEQLAAASRLEDGVPFYRIYDSDVARRFHIDPAAKRLTLVFLTKEENFTLYDGEFRAYDIARFVTANKLTLARTRAQETAPSIYDNPINKQSSEEGGQTMDEIIEEAIPP